jgi:hypothetical protein
VNDAGQKVLYAIVCGAPPARDVGKLVDLAQAAGWDVCVIASPDGRRFIDAESLTAKTGHTVRSAYKEDMAIRRRAVRPFSTSSCLGSGDA